MTRKKFYAWQLVAIIILGALIFLPGQRATADDSNDIAVAITQYMNSNGILSGTSSISVMALSEYSGYALAEWSAGNSVGDALLQQINGSWQILSAGPGGRMNADIVAAFGVPQTVATALATNWPQQSQCAFGGGLWEDDSGSSYSC